MDRYIATLFILVSGLFFTLFVNASDYLNTNNEKTTAVFNFSQLNMTENTRVELAGLWCFNWREFIDPSKACPSNATPFYLPSKWNEPANNHTRYPRQGFASYSAHITLPEHSPPLGLFVPVLYRAATIFINGKLVLNIGKPGKTKDEEVPRDARYSILIPTDTTSLDLVIHISSFHHIDGGINKALEIAPIAVLAKEERVRTFTSIFMIGSSMSFAIYFLFMGLGPATKRNIVYIVGAMSILTYTIRVIGTEQVWLIVDPSASALWILRYEYYGLVLSIASFLYYLYYLFPGVVNHTICKSVLALALISSGFITLTPVEVFAWLRDPWIILYIANLMYCIYCIGVAIHKKMPDSLLTGIIALLVVATTANDLFLWFNVIAGSQLINYTYLSLLIGNVLILILRMRRSANHETILSKKIQELNVSLQKKVAERTQELAQKVNEVERQKQIAEQANSAKSLFLATASHDLRQPLHALGLFIGSLRFTKKSKEREDIQEKLEITHDSLTQLFDALLDISKIDADVLEMNIQTVAVKPLLSKVINDFSVTASKKNIILTLYARELFVETDPIWLERIVRNLLSNALRYTHTGKVIICLRKHQGEAKIQVIDTGIGIPKENLEDIFQEFTQITNTMAQGRLGLGLGLSIVQKLCGLLGHSVVVDSTVGKGSVFTVELGECVTSLSMSVTTSPLIEFDNLKGKVILVADDEEEVRTAMKMMLNKWGIEVIQADSKDNVILAINDNGNVPDILITDYRFADQYTGLDIIREVNAVFAVDLPTLMVTAETSADKVKMFKEAGVRVLHKPVQQAKIRMMLSYLCQQIG